jgi:tripartite-type tricarboxylate transporter receptor subunit TctC
MAGINIVRINYKGTGPAVNALIAGEVQMMFPNAPSVASHLKSGRLKALAVGSARSSALAPGLPTVAASGLPGYEAVTNTGVFAPAKTPAAIVGRLNQEILRILAQPDVKERLFNLGVETVGSTPEQLTAMMKSEIARIGKVITDAGIREE